jgi:general secretion pathway protein L
MSIVVFVPEHPQDAARYRWAALGAGGGAGPLQTGLAGVPPGADAVLVAPAAAVRLTAAKLPAKNRRRLAQLAFAVEEGLAADAAALHAVAGPDLADGRTVVAVCERSWIDAALAAVQAAGLAPVSMRVETLLPALESGSWCVIWAGAGGFVRTGPASGFGFDRSTDGAPLALRLALAENARSPRRIVLRAAAGVAAPDAAAWAAELGVPVAAGDPFPGLEAGWEKSVELLEGEFARAGRFTGMLPLAKALRPAAIVAALIVIAQLALTAGEWWMLRSEKQRLQARMEQNFRAAFPGAQQVIDPVLQMQRQLAQLRRQAGAADDGDFLVLAARAAPALRGARVKLVGYERSRLEIDAAFPSAQAIEDARRGLIASGAPAEITAGTGNDARIVVTAGGAS